MLLEGPPFKRLKTPLRFLFVKGAARCGVQSSFIVCSLICLSKGTNAPLFPSTGKSKIMKSNNLLQTMIADTYMLCLKLR